MFELDARLKNDTVELGDWSLSKVLLMNDAQYPWVILVPRRESVVELFDLNQVDRLALLEESMRLATAMKHEFQATKMNVANLGNVVKQLHIHHVARFESDASWPRPVWGAWPAQPYGADALSTMQTRLKKTLQL